MDVLDFLERLQKVRPNRDGWTACCPGHEDKSPSLSVGQGADGRILVKCFAGCPPEQIVSAVGLTLADLMPPSEDRGHRGLGGQKPAVGDEGPIGRVEAVYEYPNAAGRVEYLVARYRTSTGKTFRPFHAEGGVWRMGAGSALWPLYRLPELQEALALEKAVWVVEGEKCVEALVRVGLTATTSHGGAKGWKAEYARQFEAADVILCPDHDEPGEAYAAAVLASLKGVARSVRVVRLPGLGEGGDVYDYLASGKTRADLERLADVAPPPTGDGTELPPPEYVPPEKLWMSFGEIAEERAGIGTRFGTGMALLDAKLDGGLYAGTLTAVQGAPGAGKTALATQWALHMAAEGCAVACYFGDEGNNGAFVTICQQLGAPRSAALANDLPGVADAMQAVEGFRWFRIVRPSHKEATLERMVEGLVKMSPNGQPRVLLIDSAQVLRLADEKPRESPVERVQRAVHELRELTLAHQLVTLLVSRVHRGAFGKKKEEEEVDPVAAAWGGATEWLAELIVHLDGKPTPEEPKVRMRVAKNRVSVSGVFTVPLRIDWKRKRFVEVDPSVDEREKEAARAEALAAMKAKILKQLIGRDGVTTHVLKKEVGGRAVAFVQARQDLAAEGAIHARQKKGKGGGEEWFLGPAPEVSSTPAGPPAGKGSPEASRVASLFGLEEDEEEAPVEAEK